MGKNFGFQFWECMCNNNWLSLSENQQQTQPTFDAGSGNRTRDTLVGGEHSHHCTIPADSTVITLFFRLHAILHNITLFYFFVRPNKNTMNILNFYLLLLLMSSDVSTSHWWFVFSFSYLNNLSFCLRIVYWVLVWVEVQSSKSIKTRNLVLFIPRQSNTTHFVILSGNT